MNIQNTLKIVKSLKLSFDLLGYAVIDGKLLKDAVNGKTFYYSNKDKQIYRLTNGKALQYKIQ